MMKKRFLMFSASLPFLLSPGHGMVSDKDYQNQKLSLQNTLKQFSKRPNCRAYTNATLKLKTLEAQHAAACQAQGVVEEEPPVAAAVAAPAVAQSLAHFGAVADDISATESEALFKAASPTPALLSALKEGSLLTAAVKNNPLLPPDDDGDLQLALALSQSEQESHSGGSRSRSSSFNSLSEDEDASAPAASAIPLYKNLGKSVRGQCCYRQAACVPAQLLVGGFQDKKYLFYFEEIWEPNASEYQKEIEFYETLKERVLDPFHKQGLEEYLESQKKKLVARQEDDGHQKKLVARQEDDGHQKKLAEIVKQSPALPAKVFDLLDRELSIQEIFENYNFYNLDENAHAGLVEIASQAEKKLKAEGAASAAPQKKSKVTVTTSQLPEAPSAGAVAAPDTQSDAILAKVLQEHADAELAGRLGAAFAPSWGPKIDPELAQQNQEVVELERIMGTLPVTQGLTSDAHVLDVYAKNNYPTISQLAHTLLGMAPGIVATVVDVTAFLDRHKSTLQNLTYLDLDEKSVTFDAAQIKIAQTWTKHAGGASTQSNVSVDQARAISFRLLEKLVNDRGVEDPSVKTLLQQFVTQAYDAGDTCIEGHINRHMLSTLNTLQALTKPYYHP